VLPKGASPQVNRKRYLALLRRADNQHPDSKAESRDDMSPSRHGESQVVALRDTTLRDN
jgi:hypothetical protein